MNAKQVLSAIKRRSSARAYSTEQLTQLELEIILKAGLMAPALIFLSAKDEFK